MEPPTCVGRFGRGAARFTKKHDATHYDRDGVLTDELAAHIRSSTRGHRRFAIDVTHWCLPVKMLVSGNMQAGCYTPDQMQAHCFVSSTRGVGRIAYGLYGEVVENERRLGLIIAYLPDATRRGEHQAALDVLINIIQSSPDFGVIRVTPACGGVECSHCTKDKRAFRLLVACPARVPDLATMCMGAVGPRLLRDRALPQDIEERLALFWRERETASDHRANGAVPADERPLATAVTRDDERRRRRCRRERQPRRQTLFVIDKTDRTA